MIIFSLTLSRSKIGYSEYNLSCTRFCWDEALNSNLDVNHCVCQTVACSVCECSHNSFVEHFLLDLSQHFAKMTVFRPLFLSVRWIRGVSSPTQLKLGISGRRASRWMVPEGRGTPSMTPPGSESTGKKKLNAPSED